VLVVPAVALRRIGIDLTRTILENLIVEFLGKLFCT
jgi:hypothetical protein